MRPAWAGALYYLLFHIMLSQSVGAAYYLSYVYRLFECQAIVFAKQYNKPILGWDALYEECAINDQIGNGILSDIYKNKIGSRSSLQRFMYCFSWGLKCLSSMGQNFDTSASIVEAVFSFSMTIFGLVLFAGLIAQMQTCIQSLEPGEEQHMIRQREVEEWAKKHQIPPELKKNLRQALISVLRGLRGLDDDTMLSPMDLQCDIRRHLYSGRACNLPFFANLDHELVHSFIGHLRIFSCLKETYIVTEGDLCGSELLTWASLPFASIQHLPSSSQSIKCLTNVEAFSLLAEDLKLLGIHFSYCWKFQQALRWHS
ncbi:cyclic nucleotide-gated ion channel 18-like isoform X2 [Chenopodium quinoa]|uniref:cyclic nucleotide-gated ion channel 18-like isoform X2 n=1 Tax=Chenopodium quinoa TaxID=63459 RepID=UPI000B786544|nr:cyclic nucleotide-gated ion channel 18-like isoform X2 [Chenopodium quinoa]